MIKTIYCCKCKSKVNARLTNGAEVYPHRKDLHSLKFWRCDDCDNFVGCHKQGSGKKPLGIIASQDIKDWRKKIHAKLDPLWQSKKYSRKRVYQLLSDKLGYDYHTANLRTVEECKRVINLVDDLARRPALIIIDDPLPEVNKGGKAL